MSDSNVLYLEYKEHRTGGEPRDKRGEWTTYEPQYVEWYPVKCAKDKENVDWIKEIVDVTFEPKVNDFVYLVVVRYKTGNSFGTTCGEWKIIGFYQTSEEAVDVAKSIENGTFESTTISIVWDGYFQSLETVDIFGMVVK